MSKTLSGIIKLILGILIILYTEKYFWEFLAWIGININSLSTFTKEIIILVLYVLIFYCIYIVYKEDIQGDYNRFKRNWFPNILMSIVFFAIITIVVWVVSYLCAVVANSFGQSFIEISHYHIFEREFNLNLVFFIIKNIIIIPFISCVIYILGINEVITNRKMAIFWSGVAAAIIAGLTMKGSFLTIFFSVIPYFALYLGLAYIYRKNNNNIWYSLTSIILYTLLASLLIAKIS